MTSLLISIILLAVLGTVFLGVVRGNFALLKKAYQTDENRTQHFMKHHAMNQLTIMKTKLKSYLLRDRITTRGADNKSNNTKKKSDFS